MKAWVRSWVRISILRKGMSGQSRFWFYIGALGLARRLYLRFAQKDEQVVFGEQIKEGDRWQLHFTDSDQRAPRRSRR